MQTSVLRSMDAKHLDDIPFNMTRPLNATFSSIKRFQQHACHVDDLSIL